MGKLSFCSFLLVVKNENLVSLSIPILSESLFASSQFSRDLSSVLAILNKASLDLWKMNMLVSSANNLGTAFLNAFGMSLMYIRNRRGPSTDPCGTPHSIIWDEDVAPLILVNCLRLYR